MEWYIKKFDELTIRELYEIMKQRIDVFVVEQDCIYRDCDDKDLSAYHVFAREGNVVTAYLRILLPGVSYKEVSIGRVLTNGDFRGKGLGRELMKRAMEFIENEMREYEVRISGQKYLEKFYQDFGFQTVSDTYLEDGIPHVQMLYVNENRK